MLPLFSSSKTLSLLLAVIPTATLAFAPSSFSAAAAASKSPTRLYISSWGTKGPPSRWTAERENPADNVAAYLPEPEAVEARANIDGRCLVSGLLQENKNMDDQFLFDLLNHQDSAFEFEAIVAFSSDSKRAKKRLLSRSARYTGLLDKLDFIEGNDALPSVGDLTGVKSWIAYVEVDDTHDKTALLTTVEKIAQIVQGAPSVENVAILLANANELDVAASQQALAALQSAQEARKEAGKASLQYTLVAVGQLQDHPEGQDAYMFEDFGTDQGVLPAKAIFSRQEAYRMVTELLQLESGVNQALAFAEVYNVNATQYKLVKGLREAGYARPQEIDHMVRDGVEAYKKAVEEYKTVNPDAAKGYTTNAWWEKEEFQASRRRSDERAKLQELAVQDERTQQIQEIAKEWVKREYFKQSMAGTIENDMSEEEFSKTVWDRAMLEGDMKYRQSVGEVVDEEAELLDFKGQQERKQAAMLKKAKKELAEVLGEEIPDDDDEDN